MSPHGSSDEREVRQPTLSGAWFLQVAVCLGAESVAVDQICRDLGLDFPSLVGADRRFPRDWAIRVWREAERRSSDPLLGLHASRHFRMPLGNVLPHLLTVSANLGDALAALARYQAVLAAGPVFSIDRRGGGLFLQVELVQGRLPLSRHQIEFVLGALTRTIGAILDAPAPIERICFRHRSPGFEAEFERLFGCAVEFDAAENGLLLTAAALRRPLPHHSPKLADRMTGMAEDELAITASPSTAYLAEVAMRLKLGAGMVPTLDSVARELHVSTRSLQRRLAEESESFSALLDAARRTLARSWLEGGMPVDTVARRLGFSSRVTFGRAHQRWIHEHHDSEAAAGRRRA